MSFARVQHNQVDTNVVSCPCGIKKDFINKNVPFSKYDFAFMFLFENRSNKTYTMKPRIHYDKINSYYLSNDSNEEEMDRVHCRQVPLFALFQETKKIGRLKRKMKEEFF